MLSIGKTRENKFVLSRKLGWQRPINAYVISLSSVHQNAPYGCFELCCREGLGEHFFNAGRATSSPSFRGRSIRARSENSIPFPRAIRRTC